MLQLQKELTIDFHTNLEHIVIRGDNKDVLPQLKDEFEGKVDFIYIDPPYNTDSNNFTYKDKFKQEGDKDKHSSWLKFMEERLILSKDLLSDNGLIFIAIDNREYPYLKILSDEIFGEENSIGPFVWKKTGQQQNNGKNVAVVTEYIICFAKNLYDSKGSKKDLFKKELITNRKGASAYRFEENGVKFRVNPVQDKTLGKHEWEYLNPVSKKVIHSKHWRLTLKKFKEMDEENKIYWGTGKSLPQVKKFLPTTGSVLMSNIIDGYFNEQGASLLRNIVPEAEFTNPKPLELLKYLIKHACPENGIVLDFFGGSGTTLHAVLDLNSCGDNRRGILITKDEADIFENITYKRIKVVSENGYMDGKNKIEPTEETVLIFHDL
jgi:adenine-specific DNA-methyltransferase